MTKQEFAVFTDTLTDSLRGNWPRIIRALMDRPHIFASHDVKTFYNDPAKLRRAIADCYEISDDKADVILKNLAEEVDGFANSADMRRQMSQFWTELTDADFTMIAGRRSSLASVLQDRYGLTRDDSWLQIHQFFARMKYT